MRTECVTRRREAEAGIQANKLTQGRRRRTFQLLKLRSKKKKALRPSAKGKLKGKKEKLKRKAPSKSVLYKAPTIKVFGKMGKPEDLTLLQEAATKFDWDDVWGQKSWTTAHKKV